MNMSDDEIIGDAFARRSLSASEARALDNVHGFIGRHEFAAQRRHAKLAVELMVAAAVGAIAVTLIVALARHTGPTSSVSSRPHLTTPPPAVVTSPPSAPATPTAAPTGSCPGPLSRGEVLLSGIQTIGSQHIWAAASGRILSSRDGGHTWQTEFSGAEQFSSIDAIDDNHAWAVGADALYGTADGGHTWLRLGEPATALASVHFVSDSQGFGVASGTCTVVESSDGGHTWRWVQTAPAAVTSVCFPDSTHGWVGADGIVSGTADGGKTWSQRLDTRNPQVGPAILALQCAAPSGVSVEAWSVGAAAGSQPNAAWTTADGVRFAQVWVSGMWSTPSSVASGPGSYPGPFSIVDPTRTVWIGTTPAVYPYNSSLLETSGHDVTSPSVPVTCNGAILGAAFISPAHGWVLCVSGMAGTEGSVLVTNDGGHTWTVQYRTFL